MKWNSNDKIKSTWLLDQLLEWSYENQQLNAAPAGLISRGRLDLSPRYPQPRIRILKNLPSCKGKVRVISSDPQCTDGNVWFTTVPLKHWSDQ